MATLTEAQLEHQLLSELQGHGYERVSIPDQDALVKNLKRQLEKHNRTTLSDYAFEQVLNQLSTGNVFRKATRLRQTIDYRDEQGETHYLQLLNVEQWCRNEYQVTHQITMVGKRENRYDVTILINGLPLVQIELKKSGVNLHEAFKQIVRYKRETYSAGYGLFDYIQCFVISNGTVTKYFANRDGDLNDKFLFTWADIHNKAINNLQSFTNAFLERCHISKMIARYMVLQQTDKYLMILRPYQYYAVEAIVQRVEESTENGYIWHTTGSGKTLTSFKAAQVLTTMPQIHKVLFVVDRRDLDSQTTAEFNAFKKGSVSGTSNTRELVNQLTDDTPLIVTTIQKLNKAISAKQYAPRLAPLSHQRIVIIFDECHRSQFGKTHAAITRHFQNNQLFGFTGTPIFPDNAQSQTYRDHNTGDKVTRKVTTDHLFTKVLHKYRIADAIRDQNVLPFSIEYISTFKGKDGEPFQLTPEYDTREIHENPQRLDNVVQHILSKHRQLTRNQSYTAIFCTPNIPTLYEYYKRLKPLAQDQGLTVAAIFTYQQNDELADIPDTGLSANEAELTLARDWLDTVMRDYNQAFGTDYQTSNQGAFYQYYNHISKAVKSGKIDILLVVNIFLTGFDAPTVNTLYVDKNLKHHGLIQAFSRTNRIHRATKPKGNIVCYRDLKKATDVALKLFSSDGDEKVVIMPSYEEHLKHFKEALSHLRVVTPAPDDAAQLPTEIHEIHFIEAFRNLIRIKALMETYSDHTPDALPILEEEMAAFQSHYFNLKAKAEQPQEIEKESALSVINFEIELLEQIDVTSSYILKLVGDMYDSPIDKYQQDRAHIISMIESTPELRSKRDLYIDFMDNRIKTIPDKGDVLEAFESFLEERKEADLNQLIAQEDYDGTKLRYHLSQFIFSRIPPTPYDLVSCLITPPRLLQRDQVAERLYRDFKAFVEVYID